MSARTFTLHIPAPCGWLNANTRRHGRARADDVRTWRAAGHTYARHAKLPQLGKARIIATLHFTDQRRRDDHNYFPTIKALIDGLVDHGVLPDDSRQYLAGVELRGGDPIPRKPYGPAGTVELTITEEYG